MKEGFVRKDVSGSPEDVYKRQVHGIFDYGVQVPMGQSVRMFKAYTEKGVKSLLLCNNNGPFGEDPEVKMAVVKFLTSRV